MHTRRSIRLKEYDYSSNGAYFITICTYNKQCLFGDISNEKMILNECGEIVLATWNDLPNHNNKIAIDEFIIMPNHIHGIINIVGAGSKPALGDAQGNSNFKDSIEEAGCNLNTPGLVNRQRAGLEPAPTGVSILSRRVDLESASTDIPKHNSRKKAVCLSEIVRQFKTFSARRINQLRNTAQQAVWQRNYYEHIIRNENSFTKIREYIRYNPLKWDLDENNPKNAGSKKTGSNSPHSF